MSESNPELENGARSPVASGPSDPDALRAAALLTLKRRKPPAVDTSGSSGPSHRPPPTDTSLQLDYGQEDIGSSPTDVAKPPVSFKTSHPDLEDGQMREEGEISDSEDASSKLASKPALPVDTPIVVKVESPTHNLLDRIRDPPHPGPSLTPVSLGEHFIDPDHVRPGLSMNQDQYDTAKDIVLDLLGWGVSPDYLVDCNLSREIVYYVFSELNLRLPHNLDITGLIPYTPAHVALYSRPLSAIPHSARPETSASSRPLHGHPSLPPKPLAGPNATIGSGPSPVQKSAGTQPSSPPHPSSPPISTNQHASTNGSLHDMERQRRQELLARKAVQASRKVKPPSDASSTASSSYAPADPSGVQDQDVEMTPAIATEAVDDFLKSIGEKSVTPEAMTQPESTDIMDVDEIPGLGGSMSSYRSANSSQAAVYTDQVVISPADSSFSAAPNHSLSQSDPPPSSGETDTTTYGLDQASFDGEQLSRHHALQRRGSKRPTAADFVDFDPGSRNGHHHGSMPNPLRRKTASFASVSGHRKLVIDLSDSDGEGEDYVMHDSTESERWEGGSGYSSPAPGRYPAPPISGGRATPPYNAGTTTPAVLMEKENEIRKMRELIAQREKSRQQKVMSRSSAAAVESPRREDDDQSMHTNGSTAPPYSNGHHASLQENGTIPAAIPDKRPLTDSNMAGSASTSASATPPLIDPEEMADQRSGPSAILTGAQDSATVEAASQHPPVNGNSTQEAPQEPVAGLVDVDSALSSSAQTPSPTTSALPRPGGSRPTSPAPSRREDSKYNYYAAYDSPFECYPLLRLRSRHMFSGDSTSAAEMITTQASRSPTTTTTTTITCSSQSSSLSSFPSSSSTSILSASSSITSLPSFSSSSSSSTYSTVFPLPNLEPLKLAACSALDPAKRICQYEVPGGGVCRDAGCEDLHLSRLGREGWEGVVEPSGTSSWIFCSFS
ncbi:hypothetical protein B0H11DRAFT_1977627 [Mycena galericulata]|nr:hypothetical protein B0H11DRAFT_1977627 [Mycena galericulata]